MQALSKQQPIFDLHPNSTPDVGRDNVLSISGVVDAKCLKQPD